MNADALPSWAVGMSDRIRSQHGNVIAADFRPHATLDASVEIRNEVLYRDDRVMLTRLTALLGGKPSYVTHFLGDLETGALINL